MNETIILPVEYLGRVYEFPLTFVTHTYTYHLHIQVNGKTLIFEQDDQQQYRVIDESNDGEKVNKSLIEAIVATLQSL